MSLYSAVRGLWWVGSEVVDAVKQLALFQPGREDSPDAYAEHLAKLREELVEREAAEEVSEPAADCGLGAAELNELYDDVAFAAAAFTSAAPGVAPVDAADNGPGVTPDPTPGPPSLDWCAAEMRQVADLLLTTGLPMARGYANDLRAAAATHSATLGQDPASVHDRTMRQRHNEDKREMP